MIPGVILASGLSTRMGTSKALLPIAAGGPTFVAHIATALREGGVAFVLVVGRPEDDELRREVETLGADVRFVENAHAHTGQLSSVIAGLNAADTPDIRALLVIPVDAPLIRATTVAALLAAFTASDAAIARATYRGRHGHPVIFSRAVFDELRTADPAKGAKPVVHANNPLNVEVDDAGVLHDIDDAAEYKKMMESRLPTTD